MVRYVVVGPVFEVAFVIVEAEVEGQHAVLPELPVVVVVEHVVLKEQV
jgi:hypothetical protein